MYTKKGMIGVLLVLTGSLSHAQDITFSTVDNGDGTLAIYAATSDQSLPLGISLSLSSPNGQITNVVSVHEQFPVCLDYMFTEGVSADLGQGHPLADPYNPGSVSLPASQVSLSLGSLGDDWFMVKSGITGDLNGDGQFDLNDMELFVNNWLVAGPAICDLNFDDQVDYQDYAIFMSPANNLFNDSVPLVVLEFDGIGTDIVDFTLDIDYLRGGCVDDNGALAHNLPITGSVTIPEPCCLLLLGLGAMVVLRKKK
ncbi:MAG: hypothetical protein JW709_01860 [Sedimentisphaerales bacterium]|nr:hypothetical protein [Sedimentisphaerales bacterium]